ncbi:uncharacterized protein LOC141878657 [Acropora palmata]|uniref:uncharacterized protein LOC141878657 n=1 Tax=Acropora palmata TaxID=6131 RepID=UPI003DA1641F
MFILRKLYEEGRKVSSQICVGSKVISLQSGNLKFVDSFCFIPQPLASFPATFGLTELKKGFFPHLFNTVANQTYVGPIPAKDYYDPEGMSEAKCTEFTEWYDVQTAKGYVFNMKIEIIACCQSDVRMLKEGCLRFQKEFEEQAGFNPFEKCITIASSCMRYFRKVWLQPNLIAVEPSLGWHGSRTNQSMKALEWLHWCEHKLRPHSSSEDGHISQHLLKGEDPIADRIAHMGNRGEHRVRTSCHKYEVDGFDKVTKTVYEFHGCYIHGCPRCHKGETRNKSRLHPDRTLGELFEETEAKETNLRAFGYNVVTMWECDWERLKQQCEDIRACLSDHPIHTPLNPRDAFYGGRTNAVVLHSTTDEAKGEKIHFVDVMSLYPWVNKYCQYPVGHPEIKTHLDGNDLSAYFGLAKVDVIPPPSLYHPVLPLRSSGKLIFPLCRTCVDIEMGKRIMLERTWVCSHTPQQRMMTGTWCTPELEKAVSLGYEIIRIHEVWHFPRYKTGLFKDYVNTWLKIKVEASGWPSGPARDPDHPQCQEARQLYVREYLAREGINLDPDEIVKNPGRKATAKLMLNSFWGKFGERLNKCQVEQVTTPARFYDLLRDASVVIHAVRVANENMLDVTYNLTDQTALKSDRTNIFVAAFTTCWARLKLYSYLEMVKDNALYYDTDSVIYKWRPGQAKIPLGNFLGDMTDELEDPEDYIVEFVSGGPKNYGYRTLKGQVCCKIRGFTLNKRGKQQLNYDILKQMVIQELREPHDNPRQIPVAHRNPIKTLPASFQETSR